MTEPARWQPLLAGEHARRARAAIAAIVDDLAAQPPVGPSLADGLAGVALLHGYRARARQRGAGHLARQALAGALEAMVSAPPLPWLFAGWAGVGWVMHHIGDVVPSEPASLEVVDDLVLRTVRRDDWPFEYELMGGLVGLGGYALERGAGRAAGATLDHVLGHLQTLAVRTAEGACWRNSPALLVPEHRAANPGGYHNLGMAHGAAGVVSFLAGVVQRGAASPGASELLAEAVSWLRARRRAHGRPRYPAVIADGLDAERVTDGWCYGDPGTAAALVQAGVAARRPDWLAEGIDLARDAGTYPDSQPLADASFCHGTLGRAHIFARLGQAAGCELLRDHARAWYLHTLDLRAPGSGVGGFTIPPARPGGPPPDAGLRGGAAGVALGLLAAVSPVEPAWDRLFGCSWSTQAQ